MENNSKYVGFNKYVICNSRILNTQTKSNIHDQRKNVKSDVFLKQLIISYQIYILLFPWSNCC